MEKARKAQVTYYGEPGPGRQTILTCSCEGVEWDVKISLNKRTGRSVGILVCKKCGKRIVACEPYPESKRLRRNANGKLVRRKVEKVS